jgi:ethanolamine ammonia-lyase small subunit
MTPDSWSYLKGFSSARVAMGRAGGSVPTRERLDFQLAHAKARDAVVSPFNPTMLAKHFDGLAFGSIVLETLAHNRIIYLRRPDLGRKLSETSRMALEPVRKQGPWDLVIVVSDGLSTFAVMDQSWKVLSQLLPRLQENGWKLAPLMIIGNARVAVQDEIGSLLNAKMSLMLLGERPGLGCSNSLGAYLTFHPTPGKTDADRNCISNIRSEGLAPEVAARKLFYLLSQSRRLQMSGVSLKDNFNSSEVGNASLHRRLS